MTADVDIVQDVKTTVKVEHPKKYNVVLLNDDYTPMDFVIFILTDIFDHSDQNAAIIMMKIHNEGSGIAGTYGKDIAETKRGQTLNTAHKYGHPLKAVVQEAPTE